MITTAILGFLFGFFVMSRSGLSATDWGWWAITIASGCVVVFVV